MKDKDIAGAVARNFNDQGELFRFQGQYAKAGKCYKEALAKFEQIHQDYCGRLVPEACQCPACRVNIAMVWDNQAKICDDMGEYVEAEKIYTQALELYEQIGIVNVDFVIMLNSLAMFYHHRWHDYQAAKQYYDKAFMKCHLLGDDTSYLVHLIQANQEQLYLDQATNQRRGAEELAEHRTNMEKQYDWALYAHNRLSLPNAFSQRALLNNSAVACHLNGNREKARQKYEQTLQFYQKKEWMTHFSYAVTLTNYAIFLLENSQIHHEDFWRAYYCYDKAEKIYRDGNGEYYEFYQVADFLYDYSRYFIKRNDKEKVIELFGNALRIYCAKGIDIKHYKVVYTLSDSRRCHRRDGLIGWEKYEPFFQKVLDEYDSRSIVVENIHRGYEMYNRRRDNHRSGAGAMHNDSILLSFMW